MKRRAASVLTILRGALLALLFGICYAAGYVVCLIVRLLLYAGAAFVAGWRSAW